MKFPLHAILLAAVALPAIINLAGCSNGSGGAAQSAPITPTLDLVLDAAVGDGLTVTAMVDGAVLERPDGSVTANLLPASMSLVLAHPVGQPQLLSLQEVPPGTYVGMQLLVRRTGGMARGGDGISRPIDLGAPVLRVTLDEGAASLGSARSCWQLRHNVAPPAGAAAGGAGWSLDLSGSSQRASAWDSVRVLVAAVDVAASTVDVVWSSGGVDVPVTLLFDGNSVLLSDSRVPLDLAGFLAAVSTGSILEVDGTFGSGYSLLVRSAKIEDSLAGGGDENKIVGRITGVDAPGMNLTVQVLTVRRGSAVAGAGPLPELVVDASAASIYRSGSEWIPLSFGELATDDLVEVEWRGAVLAGNTVRAREVELEDRAGSTGAEVEGEVGAVDTTTNTILLVPRRNDPLLVDGQSWATVQLEVDAATALYLDRPSHPVTLQQVAVGQRIWIKGVRTVGSAAGGEPIVRGQRVRIRN